MNAIRRFFLAVLSCFVASCGAKSKPPDEILTVDPKKILYSLPTICDPAPACDPNPAPTGAKALHEDDWRQIELVAASNRAYIERELAKLSTFKDEHRKEIGFDEIYIRKEHPAPLMGCGMRLSNPPALQESALSLGRPPYGGTVVGGFALTDSNGWFLYGQRDQDEWLIHLAIEPASVRPTVQFARAVADLANDENLLVVDWYATMIVDTSSPDSVLEWASRYIRD